MEVLKKAAGGRAPPEFLSTHPDPDNRVERIKEAIQKARNDESDALATASICERSKRGGFLGAVRRTRGASSEIAFAISRRKMRSLRAPKSHSPTALKYMDQRMPKRIGRLARRDHRDGNGNFRPKIATDSPLGSGSFAGVQELRWNDFTSRSLPRTLYPDSENAVDRSMRCLPRWRS